MTILESGYPQWGTDFSETLEYYIEVFTTALEEKCNSLIKNADRYKKVCEAMKYSLEAGGKRIRPVLVLEFCRICGGKLNDAIPAAIAIEMVHTFSLIHDDLPCMDNDDMRRGRPSCHKAYGEAVALLAGDALTFTACEILTEVSDSRRSVEMIRELCKCSFAMIGGQTIDTEGVENNFGALSQMYELKTSRLINAACVMGCIAAGASDEIINSASRYAENLGLAFQIIDDILDVTADEKTLGKPVGSDADQDKVTSVSLFGLEKAAEMADEYTKNATEQLNTFDNNGFLTELTDILLKRNK